MDFESYLTECREDPEYRKVARELKPILDLADEVFELRMERGWTQEELAEKVGTAQANISRLENGLANPTFESLRKLAEAFGTELSISLRGQPRGGQTLFVPVLLSRSEYRDLFVGSASVSAREELAAEIVGVVP